jgi:hypothetical protein
MNPLLWIFRFVFGCHHRHQSRVFTIKRRTYKVCFDCGEEFELPDAQVAPLDISGSKTRTLGQGAGDRKTSVI